jgi:hypothetical protein
MFLVPLQQINDENYIMIPRSSLGYTTNNIYPSIPPFMSDGRSVIASWQPESIINKEIVKENNLKTNWEYRQFMIQNANSIIEYNRREAYNDIGYYKRFVSENQEPVDKSLQLNPSQPQPQQLNMNSQSDLKNMYFTRNQLQMQKISQEITPEQLNHSINY